MRSNLFPRIILLFTLALSISSLTNAQTSKNVAVSNFNAVIVSHGIDLYLTQGGTESLKITTHPDLIKEVIVEKKGTQLEIKLKDNFNWSRLFKGQSIKVYLNYKTLYALTASGGSDVYTQNRMKTERLAAKASGGSDLKLSLVCKDLQVQSSGGSDAELSGSATNVSFQASGGSDIEALDLKTEYAKVSASGGSDVNVNVNKAIEASASGGSDVHYRGNAALKKTSSSVSGDVKRIN